MRIHKSFAYFNNNQDASTCLKSKTWFYDFVTEEFGPKKWFVQCHLCRNSIRAEVINDSQAGNPVLISKIMLRSSDAHLPFQLSHLRPPVKLAYPMTIL